MQEDLEKRAGRFHFGIIGGLIILAVLVVAMFGEHFYTVHPAIRAVANGVPVCGHAEQIIGGEASKISRLKPDEQERFFLAMRRKDSNFSFPEQESSTVLLYQRKEPVVPLFVVVVPIDKEAAPGDIKFCELFEQTPWDGETDRIAKDAGENWRMRSMLPERNKKKYK